MANLQMPVIEHDSLVLMENIQQVVMQYAVLVFVVSLVLEAMQLVQTVMQDKKA
jgi:hypothetical protein